MKKETEEEETEVSFLPYSRSGNKVSRPLV